MQKNVAGQKIRVFAFTLATGAPATGDAANITCKVSKDSGTATALTDVNPTETEDGYYLFDLTQNETNANTLDFYPESSTSGVQVVVTNHDRQTVAGSSTSSAVSISEGDVPFGLDGPVVSIPAAIDDATLVVGAKQVMRIRRNDSYDGTANAKKTFTVAKDYSGWTGTLTVRHRVTDDVLLSKAVTVASATALECSLSSSDTAFTALTSTEDFSPHPFDIEMVNGSSKQSIPGIVVVTKDQTTA